MASTISAGTTSGTAIAIAGDTTGALALQTNNGTTAVTIDTSQNVGIGTTSPSTYGKLAIYDSSAPQAVFANGTSQFIVGKIGGGNNNILYGTGAYPTIFYTDSTERMRIESSGRLLVGTTSNAQTSKVKIDGGGDFSLETYRSGTGAATQIIFTNSNDIVGQVQTNGSSTSYITSSDYRLKQNIAPMVGALNKVTQLKPVTYKWKTDNSDGQGFIAHELQAVMPDCVSGEKDAVKIIDDLDEEGNVIGTKEVPVYQGIDTSFLVATLTAAIQELNAKVDAQATTITALQARLGTT
jgi:hypothetical protein